MPSDLTPPDAEARLRYRVGAVVLRPTDPSFQTCLEAAYRSDGGRPRCLCTVGGAEMYITRIAGAFHLKRMPGQGTAHAVACPSYAPPAELSGLAQVLGAAIQEDPQDGTTALKLGFSLSKVARRAPLQTETPPAEIATSSGARLSLRGLLHFLWEEAGFNAWSPGMAGKRSWPVLRRHLLAAAERMRCRDTPLSDTLYLPEPWEEARKDEIRARRRARFLKLASVRKTPRRLMLLLGEVRLIEPSRYGGRLIVKHAPDVSFDLDDDLLGALRRRFPIEIAQWEQAAAARAEPGHLVVFGTFAVGLSGQPSLEEAILMWTDRNWIPVDDAFDGDLIARLVGERRRFTRCLRYNLAVARPLAVALLSDTGALPAALYIVRPGRGDEYEGGLLELTRTDERISWVWRPADDPMPDLPSIGGHADGADVSTSPAAKSRFDPFGAPP